MEKLLNGHEQAAVLLDMATLLSSPWRLGDRGFDRALDPVASAAIASKHRLTTSITWSYSFKTVPWRTNGNQTAGFHDFQAPGSRDCALAFVQGIHAEFGTTIAGSFGFGRILNGRIILASCLASTGNRETELTLLAGSWVGGEDRSPNLLERHALHHKALSLKRGRRYTMPLSG